jgi:hypothetical protein
VIDVDDIRFYHRFYGLNRFYDRFRRGQDRGLDLFGFRDARFARLGLSCSLDLGFFNCVPIIPLILFDL